MYYSPFSDTMPKTADSLFETKTTEELVQLFRSAIINQYHVLGCQYDLLETQIRFMLESFILKRPRVELLTPRRIEQIEIALTQMRLQKIHLEEGWLDIWQTIHFYPTYMWDKMKSQLGRVITNL